MVGGLNRYHQTKQVRDASKLSDSNVQAVSKVMEYCDDAPKSQKSIPEECKLPTMHCFNSRK